MTEAEKKTTRSRKTGSKKKASRKASGEASGSKGSRSKTKAKKKKGSKKTIGTCFVLMPFKEPFDTYYTLIIKPAVVAAGLACLRGDSLFRPSPIMGDIWTMIQNAKVLVAELTEKNANVFYELGLGHAIGKPIVLMSETIEDVPFDLQPLRVIIYDKDDPAWGAKLRNNLTAFLADTISNPTNAVPSMFRKRVKSQAPEEAETSTRLLALERQISALRADELGGFGSSRSGSLVPRRLVDFRHAIRASRSLEEAADITKRALVNGFPESMIRRELKSLFSGQPAEEVLALALGGRDII
jgi:hypothetical protein